MTLQNIIVAGIIASIGIFAAAVIQNQIVVAGGLITTFTGAEVLVAPAIVGAAVLVTVLEKLHTIRV